MPPNLNIPNTREEFDNMPIISQNWKMMCLFFEHLEDMTMWTKPTFIDMRLGLEVTLYISNR